MNYKNIFKISNIIKRDYSVFSESVGKLGEKDFKINFFKKLSNPKFIEKKEKVQVSPWHSISLQSFEKDLFNCVIEMPKGTQEKMEVSTKELYNPIKQDIKNGQLRIIKHGKIPYNYGMIPRTYENPKEPDHFTNIPGDNDPLDVVEVSDEPIKMGKIISVKVLGAISLIDEGETDWKIITIQKYNPLFNEIKDLDDLEKHLPGTLDRIKDWYENYKVCEGKQKNTIFSTIGPVEAKKVILVANNSYHDLISTFTLN